jgi:polar amino acid transport system permease protein
LPRRPGVLHGDPRHAAAVATLAALLRSGIVCCLWPEIRQSWAWPYLRSAWPYGVLALTLSFAGYEGEVMRGAFAGVPKGELEAGRAYGMSPLDRVPPDLAAARHSPRLADAGGETVLQLKATPLVATITVVDVYAIISRVRQDTYLTLRAAAAAGADLHDA